MLVNSDSWNNPAADTLPAACRVVRQALGSQLQTGSLTGVVLGSGLGRAAAQLAEQGGCSIPWSDIPGMPAAGASGHAGRLVIGSVGQQTVAMLQGRVHLYEGYPPELVTYAVQLLIALGMRRLILTNAAGGIRSDLQPGHLMLICGHLVCPGTPLPVARTPLTSEASPQWLAARRGRQVWSAELRRIARRIATPLCVQEGVYALMPGPCYETPAEIRMLRWLGADAVGMSTVPEALLAAACGVPTLGVSCITNLAAGLSPVRLDHADVTDTAASIERPFVDWLGALLRELDHATG